MSSRQQRGPRHRMRSLRRHTMNRSHPLHVALPGRHGPREAPEHSASEGGIASTEMERKMAGLYVPRICRSRTKPRERSASRRCRASSPPQATPWWSKVLYRMVNKGPGLRGGSTIRHGPCSSSSGTMSTSQTVWASHEREDPRAHAHDPHGSCGWTNHCRLRGSPRPGILVTSSGDGRQK